MFLDFVNQVIAIRHSKFNNDLILTCVSYKDHADLAEWEVRDNSPVDGFRPRRIQVCGPRRAVMFLFGNYHGC